MRPIRLQIEGLRSFRSSQTIDFTGRDYIAIIGDTGAGKSSILEALTFALYGRTTFSGQGHQELMNASSTALRVVFAFDVSGEHWEVTRTLRRAGTGKVSTGATSLRRFDDDRPVESFEKARDVTAKITSILGLDDEAFLRTVVLPQGQFSRLLVDDDQKLRASVLRQIWRTDELTAAGVLASDALAELGPLVGRVAQALNDEPGDAASHLAELEEEVVRCSSLLESARIEQREATAAAKAVVDSAAQVTRAENLISMLSTWNGPRAASTALEIDRADARSLDDISGVQQLLGAASEALDAVPADDDGYTVKEIATFCTLLESLRALGAQHDSATRDTATAQQELAGLAASLAAADAEGAEAAKKVEKLRESGTALADTAIAVKARLGQGQTALKDARQAASSLADAEELLQTAEADLQELTLELGGARATHQEARSSHESATTAFEGIRRLAAAADAGHGLHGGDACPVCDRDLPHTWTPRAAPELDAARRAMDRASRNLDEASAAVARQEGLLQSAAKALTDRRTDAENFLRLATTARDSLSDFLDGRSDLDLPENELLAGPLSAVAVANKELEVHEAQIASAQSDQSRIGKEQSAVGAAHRAKVAELTGARERSEKAASTYSEQLDRLPESLRPTGELDAEVDLALATLGQRNDILDERTAERRRRRDEIDTLVKRREQLTQSRRTLVDEPADRLWNTLVVHCASLTQASETLAMAIKLPAVDCRPNIDHLDAAVQVIVSANDQLGTAARASAEGAVATSEAACLLINGLAVDYSLSTDDPDGIVSALSMRTEDAALDLRTAKADDEVFRRRMPLVAALRAAGAALDDRYLVLADLAAALRDGAFPKWLTLRRSRSLLVHASRLLSEMTAGRYAFADLDDDDSQWYVFDSDNGQPRSPSSLSGGEKFVASLALALGMVEMMGRQGDRIESLFLDEGFGALDRTNLDAAVEALGSVAATGRLVAVITHLRAVAEQIDNVLSVTREPLGTRAEWLSPAARTDLAEGDLDIRGSLLE